MTIAAKWPPRLGGEKSVDARRRAATDVYARNNSRKTSPDELQLPGGLVMMASDCCYCCCCMSYTVWLTIGWSRCANSSSLLSLSTLVSRECRSPLRLCADVTSPMSTATSSSNMSETVTRCSFIDMIPRHITRPSITSRGAGQVRRRHNSHCSLSPDAHRLTAWSLHSNSTQWRFTRRQ